MGTVRLREEKGPFPGHGAGESQGRSPHPGLPGSWESALHCSGATSTEMYALYVLIMSLLCLFI